MRLVLRVAKVILLAALVSTALALLAVLALYGTLQLPSGRAFVARELSAALSAPDSTVLIEGIGPGFPSDLRLERVVLGDAAGSWFEARDLLLRWRPLALLRGRVHVETLAVNQASVQRLPQSQEEETSPEPSQPLDLRLPQLPVSLRVDRLTVGSLSLDAGVIGEPVTLSITGRVAAEEAGEAKTELVVRNLTTDSELINLSGRYQPETDNFTLRLNVNEPSGGIIMALAGNPERPPVSLRLEGEGPLHDWYGTLDLGAEGIVRVDADLAASVTGSAWSLQASGHTALPPAILPPLEPVLAQGIDWSLKVKQKTSDQLDVSELRVDGQGVGLTGAANLNIAESLVDAELHLTAQPRALAKGVLGEAGFQALEADVKAEGPLSLPHLRTTATISGLTAPSIEIGTTRLSIEARPDSDADVVPPPLKVNASVVADGVRLAEPSAQALVGDSLTAALSGTLSGDLQTAHAAALDVTAAGIRIVGTADAKLDGSTLSGNLSTSIADLQVLRPAVDAPISGSVAAMLGFAKSAPDRPLAGSLQVTTSNLRTGTPIADAALGTQPGINIGFSVDPQDVLVSPIRLDAAHFHAEGEASVKDGERLQGRVGLTVPDLSPLSKAAGSPLRGSLELRATASGSTQDPDVSALLEARKVVADGFGVERARLTLDARRVASAPEGTVKLQASTDAGPLTAHADFAKREQLLIRDLQIAASGMEVDGDLMADLKRTLVDGKVLARLQPVAEKQKPLLPVQGALSVAVRFAPQAGRQNVDVDVKGGPLTVATDGNELARLQKLSGSAQITDALGTARGTAHVQANNLSASGISLERLALGVEGSLKSAQLTVSLATAGKSPDTFDAAATVMSEGQRLTVDLERLQGVLSGQTLALDRPSRFVHESDRMVLSPLALTLGPGTIVTEGQVRTGVTKFSLQAHELPLAIAGTRLPSMLHGGRVDARVDLDTVGRSVEGMADINLHALEVRAAGATPTSVRADLHGTLGGGVAAVSGTVHGGEALSLSLNAQLPARMAAGTLAPDIDERARFEGAVDINGDLKKLSALWGVPDQQIAGALKGAFHANGTLDAPTVTGDLSVVQGEYKNFQTGTTLNNLTMRVDVRDSRTFQLALQSDVAGGGTLNGDGEATLLPDGGYRARVNVRADNAMLVRRDDVTATTNLDLNFTDDSSSGASLSGNISTSRIEVRLVSGLPPSIAQIHVVEIGKGGELIGGATLDSTAHPWSANLDLHVAMPRRVFVRGRGLDSEWQGDLTITGTTDRPRIAGEVSLVRGIFTFGSKRFDLQQGVVSFDGSDRIDPRINAVAEYRASNITALITVTGFVSKPEITLSSQPPLPQSEVMSQVLFGKSSANLSPVEAVQLAAAIDTLARGEGISGDAFSFVRTLLGLDELTVQSSGDNNGSTSVKAGRYLGSGVYVGAEQGLNDDSREGTVEVEILPGLSLESGVNQQQQSTQGSVGLKFRHDY